MLAECGQPVDAITEIDGLAGDQDPQLRNELNHREAPLRKSEQMFLMMSTLDGGTVISMLDPSRRSIRIWQRLEQVDSTVDGRAGCVSGTKSIR